MDIFILIIGLFMMGMGFLVKSAPGMIAGYNTTYTAPYLILSKSNGNKVIINFKDKTETEKAYNKIKVLTNR